MVLYVPGQASALSGPSLSLTGSPGAGQVGRPYEFQPIAAGGSGTKSFLYAGTALSSFGLSFDQQTGRLYASSLIGQGGTLLGYIAVIDGSGSQTLPISVAVAPLTTLRGLTFSTAFTVGVPITNGVITGAAVGSGIVGIPGITVSGTGTTRSYSGTPTARGLQSFVETLGTALGSPYATEVRVVSSTAQVPTLGTLVLSGALINGTASSGAIIGATAGSSIASNVSGLTINSSARTYVWDGTGAAATTANGLVETLAGATNSPRPSSVTVVAVAVPTVVFSSALALPEGDTGSVTFSYTLTLIRNGLTASYPFTWAVTGSGANPANAADFGGTFPSGSGTFGPAETTKTILVMATGDTAFEPDEAFLLTATVPGVGSTSVQGTILNDEAGIGFSAPPTITGSPGGTLTANPGTVSGATGSPVWQWYQDLVPVPGAAGTAGTLNGATYPGSITVVQKATSSSGATASAASLPFTNGLSTDVANQDDFNDGASGQLLSARTSHGWTVSGGDATDPGRYQVYTANGEQVFRVQSTLVGATVNSKTSRCAARFDVGQANQYVEIDTLGSTPAPVVMWYVDEFNFIYLDSTSTAVTPRKVVDGVVSTVWTAGGSGTTALPSTVLGMTYRYEIVNGFLYIKVRAPGETSFTQYKIAELTSGGLPGSNGYDLTGIVPGTAVGFYSSTAGKYANAIRGGTFSKPVYVSTVAVTTANNSPILTMRLIYNGTPSGFDVAAMLQDGTPLVARTAATVSTMAGGFATISFTSAALRAAEGKTIIVQAWPTGSTSGNSGSVSVPIYQTMPAYVQGINEGAIGQGRAADTMRDLFDASQWRIGLSVISGQESPDASVVFNAHGVPTNLSTLRPQGFRLNFPPADTTSDDRVGMYTITYPPSITPQADGAAITIISPGVAKYDRQRTNGYGLKITGDFSAVGPNGAISCKMDSDPTPAKYVTDNAVSAFRDLGKIIRFMDLRGTNDTQWKSQTPTQNIKKTAADRQVGLPAGTNAAITGDVMARICNEAGNHMYVNSNFCWDLSYHQDDAASAISTLNPALKIYLEPSNEVWNTQFGACFVTWQEGCRMGFAENTSTGVAAAVGKEKTILLGKFDGTGAPTPVDVPAGGLIMTGSVMGGVVVWQNKTGATIPAGASPENDPTNWLLFYTPAQVATAGRRFQAWFAATQYWRPWYDACIAAGRPVPINVMGHQTGDSFNLEETFDFLVPWGTGPEIPFRNLVDRLAIAPYWRGPGGVNILDYTKSVTDPAYSPWGSTQKALLGTNITAFRAAFWASASEGIDWAVQKAQNMKHSLGRYYAGKGLSPDRCTLMSYEANWHMEATNWPSNLAAAMKAEFAALLSSAEMGTATTRYINGLKSKVGGEHMMFARINYLPSATPDVNGTLNNWGIEWDERGTTTPRYLAFKAGNA